VKLSEELKRSDYDLVICSPLRRALHTCTEVLSILRNPHSTENPIPPIIVSPLCAERVESTCDIGNLSSVLRTEFPHFNFDELDNRIWWWQPKQYNTVSLDMLWEKISLEKYWTEMNNLQNREFTDTYYLEDDASFAERLKEFVSFLKSQQANRILVFGHCDFFEALAGVSLANCGLHTFTL